MTSSGAHGWLMRRGSTPAHGSGWESSVLPFMLRTPHGGASILRREGARHNLEKNDTAIADGHDINW